MSRTIITPKDLQPRAGSFRAGGAAPSVAEGGQRAMRVDAYVDKLLKLIPAEIIAVWVTMRGILATATQTPSWLPWVALGVLLALTPVYLKRVAGVRKSSQCWLTTGAFLVWTYSLGGMPFALLPEPYYLPVYGAVLLPLYTFAIPMLSIDE